MQRLRHNFCLINNWLTCSSKSLKICNLFDFKDFINETFCVELRFLKMTKLTSMLTQMKQYTKPFLFTTIPSLNAWKEKPQKKHRNMYFDVENGLGLTRWHFWGHIKWTYHIRWDCLNVKKKKKNTFLTQFLNSSNYFSHSIKVISSMLCNYVTKAGATCLQRNQLTQKG